MNLEEVKIQIKEMIQNIQDSLDLDYLNDEQAIEICKKQKTSLETVLNYIDNSISKEVYKELEERNRQFTNGERFTAKQLKCIEENQKKYFINKQLIKEKIEELRISKQFAIKYNNCTEANICSIQISLLQELLEGK